MKTKSLRAVAVTLSIGVCTMAQAQSTYTSPARWNNFRPVSDKDTDAAKKAVRDVVKETEEEEVAELPAPQGDTPPTPEPVPLSEPMHDEVMIESSPQTSSVSTLQHAVSAPWGGNANARLPLAPWFGSANLLFLTLEEGRGRHIASGLGTDFNTALVDPDASVGFDVTLGRYLDCNRFGLGMTYLLWNPGLETLTRTGGAGTIRAQMPAYRDVSIDIGAAGVDTIYNYIDGTGPLAGATGVRASRNLFFQGIEANLFSFGMMGAQRASRQCCNSGSLFGGKFGKRNACKGYGGAMGPLVRPCTNRVQIMTSHGFRWFQIDDEFELAYNLDGTAGYQAEDLYENVDIENNLYGYQFGGRLTYCINSRMNLNIGGKFGIYGNDARMRHRLGTQTTLAYRNGAATETINTESSDTVLATLGELDLGLGYRFSCAWSVRGGYRLMGVTGVANAVDSLPGDYYSLASSGQVHADDSYVLHGGYAGLEYNW